MNNKWKPVLENDKEFQEIFLGSYRFREKLSELIGVELSSLEICDDYEIPNWHLKQAEVNGKRKALHLMLKLIKEKD
jgi:hypothetical protein